MGKGQVVDAMVKLTTEEIKRLLRNFADLEVIGNVHENPELLGDEE